nr:SDR family NAD(P)-dependent oxidoreductase [uncultured Clostridium sp.]
MNQKSETIKQRLKYNNYIVQDHRVYEVRTLPGVTLLDMIYRMYKEYIGPEKIELREILFQRPIVTSEDFDIDIYLHFIRKDGFYKIIVESQKVKEDREIETEKDTNMECLLYEISTDDSDSSFPIEKFINTSYKKWDMDSIYDLVSQCNIRHYDFMKTEGILYQSGEEDLMELSLSGIAQKYLNYFYAHVALLDASTLAGMTFHMNQLQKEKVPYIPFTIKRFCIYHPFPEKVYAYSKLKKSKLQSTDFISYDVRILNEKGQKLAEFEQLIAKQVRNIEQIEKLLHFTREPRERNPEIIQDIREFIKDEIARIINKDIKEKDYAIGFYELGLDSIKLVELVNVFEKRFQKKLYPTLLFEYSTIEKLANYLAKAEPDFSEPSLIQSQKQDTWKLHQDVFIAVPEWKQQALSTNPGIPYHFRKRLILLLGGCSKLLGVLRGENEPNCQVLSISREKAELSEYVEDTFIQFFEIMKSKFNSITEPILLQVVTDLSEDGAYAYSLSGALKSAYLEEIKFNSQIIGVEDLNGEPQYLIRMLENEYKSAESGMTEILYRNGLTKRYVKSFSEWKTDSPTKIPKTYKEDGVYVITGGTGKLGMLLAKHIISQVRAHVLLLGRTKPDQEFFSNIENENKMGSEVLFYQNEIGEKDSISEAYNRIKKEHGSITGIFHCAGVRMDQLIINKNTEEIRTVFRPKVKGLLFLDEVTQTEPLDFFILFSSASSVVGNIGQADYASANTFLDLFAQERQNKVNTGERYGTTVSIDWCFWEEGGMYMDRAAQETVYRRSGVLPLPTNIGMSVLDQVLHQNQTQLLVLFGELNKIRNWINPLPEKSEEKDINTPLKEDEFLSDDVVIIGMAGNYPNADNLEEYYDNLKQGKDCISGIPSERWSGYDFGYEIEKVYQYGGFLKDIKKFDPVFFHISPRQAEMMDPQARLFLETAWKACEDAGFSVAENETLSEERKVGVFAGVFWNYYELFSAELTKQGNPTSFGTCSSYIPNMVSYCMNFHGPSMAIDTMCSSSLTALHYASESIRTGECEYAIAGGVNLITHPNKYLFLKNNKFLSSDGHCRSFGEGGDGYVPGEGVGAVLLTTLSRAVKGGYPIYGIIKGSAINHVGKTSGATVPDPEAQSKVIAAAIAKAGIDARTIGYVEAHGTGTALGDPIEIQGLKSAFEKWTTDRQFCAIGSVKSNIGHLEAAAGISGLMKVLLQLKFQEIFPSLHSEQLNPYIPFLDTPFYVSRTYKKWEQMKLEQDGILTVYPRRAGLSAFGANGSNAHVIVEEYIPARSRGKEFFDDREALETVIVPISAKSREILMVYVTSLLQYIKQKETAFREESISLLELAYTLQTGRVEMEYRVAFVVSETQELEEKMDLFLKGAEKINQCYQGATEDGTVEALPLTERRGEYKADKWINEKELHKLAEGWVKGYHINWKKIYANRSINKISLPTYPFECTQYWIPVEEAAANDLVKDNAYLVTPVWDVIQLEQNTSMVFENQKILVVGKTENKRNELKNGKIPIQNLNISGSEPIEEIAVKIGVLGKFEHIIWAASESAGNELTDEEMIEGQESGVMSLFRVVKALIKLGYGESELTVSILTFRTQPIDKDDFVNPVDAGVHGLIGSMAKEYPNWKIRMLDFEERDYTIEEIMGLPTDPAGDVLVKRESEWYRQKLVKVQFQNKKKKESFQKDGVYVVIGGAGGIGEVVSKYLIQNYNAQMVWIGRSVESESIRLKIRQLSRYGKAPFYIQADATDEAELTKAYRIMKGKFNKVNGVIHSAIVLSDKSLMNMEEERFRRTLRAKSDICVRMAQVFLGEELDFILFFSSFNSFVKPAGQSNYAAGCTFEDAYAQSLAMQQKEKVKIINWGYWGNIGTVATKEYREIMSKHGIGSLKPEEAMEALESLISGELDQLGLIRINGSGEDFGISRQDMIEIYQ